MTEQCIEKYFNMPAGCYCGLLLKEPLAKKMMSLLYKQSQQIKELLAANLEDTEIASWTLAYPDGEQTTVHYFTPSSNDEKIKRIKLFDKTAQLTYCDNGVFSTDQRYNDGQDDVIKFYNEKYGNEREIENVK